MTASGLTGRGRPEADRRAALLLHTHQAREALMPFTRHLDAALVSALDSLHAKKDSWWRKLLDDDEVFIAIRPKAINAYARGASIAKIEWKKRLCLSLHRKFLVVPKTTKGDEYVDLLDSKHTASAPLIVDNVVDYAKYLNFIKAAAGRLREDEVEAENEIAVACESVLDIEAVFNSGSEIDLGDERTAGRRFDIVALRKDGTLTLIELKLYKNGDVRSSEIPAVCAQLADYYALAKANEAEIIAEYAKVEAFRKDLHLTSTVRPVNRLDPIPRLLLVGFDKAQRKNVLDLKKNIKMQLQEHIPGFDEGHIRAVGNASNVRSEHLE